MSWLFPSEPERRRKRDRVLAVLAILAMIVLVARAARKDAGVLVNNQNFGERFLDSGDPYLVVETGERQHGPYPPSYVLVCVPLSALPTPVARVAWALLQCGALVWVFLLTRRRLAELWPRAAPHASVVFAGAVLLVSRFLLRDMAAGGGNLLYATLTLTGLDLAERGRERRAGLAVALGLVAKPNLGLFLVFFALRRRWRALGSALLCGALLYSLPALHVGAERYTELTLRWAGDVARFAALEELHDPAVVPNGLPLCENAMNQSLREAVFRLLRPSVEEGVADTSLVEASPAAAAWAARLASLALLAWGCVVALRARSGRAIWLAGCAFFPLSLLLSPITWKAHCVALLPLFVVLLAEASERRRWPLLAGFFAVYYLVCDLANEELLGKGSKTLLQALSVVTWGNLALLAVALVLASTAEHADDR